MNLLLAAMTEQEYRTPEWAGFPEGWWRLFGVFLLAGFCFWVFYLYRREARVGASTRLRMGLGVMRVIVLLMLATIWLEPVIATYLIRTLGARVVVLADVSESMSVVDAEDADTPRVQRVKNLLEENEDAWLRRLAEKNELRLYTFGEKTDTVTIAGVTGVVEAQEATSQPAAEVAQRPEMRAIEGHSDVGQALTAVLSELGESPIAGIVILTDGVFNRGMSISEAVSYAKRYKAPIYAVGVGATEEPPNASVTNLAAPPTTAKGDPFEIRVEVEGAGMESTPLRLDLTVRKADEDPEVAQVLESRELTLGGGYAPDTIRFELNAAEAGEFVYEARLAAVPGEAVTTDNRRAAHVLVLDEHVRVLAIAGRPSYDYRFVTTLLERDKSIDVSCWLQSADEDAVRDGDIVITQLPRQPEELFQYDVILMFDPNPQDLGAAWALAVRRLVDEFSGGVFLQAGSHYTSRFLRDTKLEELVGILPVLPDPDADVRMSEQGAWRTQAGPIEIPQESLSHPLLRLNDNLDTNRAIWTALPGVWWYLPVLREKPLAAVLMRHGGAAAATHLGKPVLLAAQPFGSGRTAFMAFDNTWRWRSTGEQYFNRFWIQLVRYLAQPRREGQSKRGTIVLDRESPRVGDFVKVEARVLDAAFVPWAEAEVTATLELPGGEKRDLSLTAAPGRPGWFTGRLVVDWSGTACLRLLLPSEGRIDLPVEELRKYIQVETSEVEFRSLAQRAEDLKKLAAGAGGAYVTLAEARGLPDQIPNANRVKPTRGVDEPLWDNGWVLGAAAVLLCIEWIVRRRNHLL